METNFESRIDFSQLSEKVMLLRERMAKVIVGQKEVVDLLLTALLADGHVLIEGVPGVAKTLMAKVLAQLIDARFSRIQFTPDLMPSDVMGTSVFLPSAGKFEFRKGPVFTNILLADEINRSPAKTQAALFEVMDERQMTYDVQEYKMEFPFIVVATQNPVEHEGTYRLPEAQLDRFMFKILVDYPDRDEEIEVLNLHHEGGMQRWTEEKPVLSVPELRELREKIQEVRVDEKIKSFIVDIIRTTRNSGS
ncbi:MAG: AAA family ATPase, partial [Odoribacter sp.]|nr:AAA family ATPase [Odoribacter sp.]